MGVMAPTHAVLKKKGTLLNSSETLGLLDENLPSAIHVNLLGSYYPMIVNEFYAQDASMVSKLLCKSFGAIFLSERTVLYLDGPPTEKKKGYSKKATRNQRQELQENEVFNPGGRGGAAQGRWVSSSQMDTIISAVTSHLRIHSQYEECVGTNSSATRLEQHFVRQ